MAGEIAIDRFGGPEVLQARVVPDRAPGPGEVRIRQTAIGVNFTDVHVWSAIIRSGSLWLTTPRAAVA
jgi:NADPH2:quinone reductase